MNFTKEQTEYLNVLLQSALNDWDVRDKDDLVEYLLDRVGNQPAYTRKEKVEIITKLTKELL